MNPISQSILNFYRRLIQLRKANETFIYGSYKDIDYKNEKLYCYYRQDEEKVFLVCANFTEKKISLNKVIQGLDKKLVLSNYMQIEDSMQPYEGRIYQVKV